MGHSKKETESEKFRDSGPGGRGKAPGKSGGDIAGSARRAVSESIERDRKIQCRVFQAHRVLLTDPEYLETAKNNIRREKVNAEYALWRTGQKFSEVFSKMEDVYLKERVRIWKMWTERLIRNLSGEPEVALEMKEPSIVFAEDLTPSETIRMDRKMLLGIVTKRGSAGSHSAILARMMNIPALTGVDVDLEKIQDGMLAVATA